jgi:hypothetical protein
MLQLALAGFGLTALWLAMGHSERGRRWAPVIGLCGQPAWLWFGWQVQTSGLEAWGLLVLSLAYTVVYARGVWVQWRPLALRRDIVGQVRRDADDLARAVRRRPCTCHPIDIGPGHTLYVRCPRHEGRPK